MNLICNDEFISMGQKYKYPISYYKQFLQLQTRKTELKQSLHKKANFLEANEEQIKAYGKICKILSSRKQQTIIVDGSAGVGKSTLAALVAFKVNKEKKGYIASAHLSIAATALGGCSLYSLLQIFKETAVENIPSLPLSAKVKKRFAGVKLLIVDEVSLIG